MPAPTRGEYIRKFGEALRTQKLKVSEQITKEAKKIISEGEGETQEVIDMCDFATGLSRQLYGLTMPSERPNHRLQEIWQPLGVVGCVTAFNFPVAVFGWNFCLAAVCGNSIIWKPSPHAEGCADLVKKIWDEVADEHKDLVLIKKGGNEAAIELAEDEGIALFSATGSCDMGKALAPKVAKRLGRSLLELGGNNAAIVCKSADIDLTIKGITFSAAGTTGQRCTTLRRLFVHQDIYNEVIEKLKISFSNLKIGDPMDRNSQVGPLISEQSFENMKKKIDSCKSKNLDVFGGERLEMDGVYVTPALVEVKEHIEEMNDETFAPILYVMPFTDLKDAINLQNSVRQGLSSSIFTNDVRESEIFLSAEGSDCGIANVNIGTSGAEIGGAFGGEKDTGGGRESGSDSWKAYMRRTTATVNYGNELPLAQGVEFDEG
ncbi:MAG: delta-1-piperideine-6-carboxylate dehydrogenase [Gammaproteobacteria bacterium]|nr:delta-1-piperideine-6-carboxylate dehydrogenase [Gammaproteobacteria bacterium]